MNAAKFTLTSTILAAALGLALGLMSTPAEAHCAGKHTGDHPHCTAGGLITYTAQLTAGAFVFGPVDVTPNQREIELRSEDDLNFDINDSPQPATWDQVFNTCGELLAPDSVDAFFVGDDNWSISKSGGVRVILADIVLQGAEVRVQLIGEVFDFSIVPFLPEPGGMSVFELTQGAINGRSEMGGPGGSQACQPPGGGSFDIFNLISSSTLEITASAPD